MNDAGLLSIPWLAPALFAILVSAMLLAFVRLMRGPSLADRVIALDLMAWLTVALIIVYAVTTGQGLFVDVAIVLALVSFLGTVAFARYLEWRAFDR